MRHARTTLFLRAATIGCALAHAALAAGPSRLPIGIGDYCSESADDGGGPAALAWDGKTFSADHVYIDNTTSAGKVGENQYEVISRTRTKDDNTKIYGIRPKRRRPFGRLAMAFSRRRPGILPALLPALRAARPCLIAACMFPSLSPDGRRA